jgi:hypothetical protein
MLQQLSEEKTSLTCFYFLGVTLLITGAIMWMYSNNIDLWNHWPISTVYIWRWIAYAGVIMILLAFVANLLDTYDEGSKFKQYLLQTFSVIGMLAFPLFVFHEMVMPAKTILMVFGFSSMFALIIPMILFFIGSYAMFRKLHGVSYQ